MVLLTGASGFLGPHIARALNARGHSVLALTRRPIAFGHADVKQVHLDLCDVTALPDLFQTHDIDTVINAAAYGVRFEDQEAGKAFAVNTAAPLALYDCAATSGVRRFIQIGSCFEYGSSHVSLSETMALKPVTTYGKTKAQASEGLMERARPECPLFILRPFGLWGVGEPSYRLAPQVVRACRSGDPLPLTLGHQVRDYSYVSDVADWIGEFVSLPDRSSPEVVNLGSGRGQSLFEFVNALATELGGQHLMKFGELPYRSDEMMELVADISKLEELLPGRKMTDVASGVREMVGTGEFDVSL